jgi:addiction module HigA family antidote
MKGEAAMTTLPLSAGYMLKNEFMLPLEISGYKLAKDIGVTQITISQIINGKRKITPDVAIRLSRYFRNSAEFWLNLQDIHDLKITMKEKRETYKRIKPFKYPKMKKPSLAQG